MPLDLKGLSCAEREKTLSYLTECAGSVPVWSLPLGSCVLGCHSQAALASGLRNPQCCGDYGAFFT